MILDGGAGTTAAGIALGRPTVIVPFFGDQPFWGAMVARAGAGPSPIPFKDLSAERLANAILKALEPETLERAEGLGERIREEKGCEAGAASFHSQLNVNLLRCLMCPNRIAVWRVKTRGSNSKSNFTYETRVLAHLNSLVLCTSRNPGNAHTKSFDSCPVKRLRCDRVRRRGSSGRQSAGTVSTLQIPSGRRFRGFQPERTDSHHELSVQFWRPSRQYADQHGQKVGKYRQGAL